MSVTPDALGVASEPDPVLGPIDLDTAADLEDLLELVEDGQT